MVDLSIVKCRVGLAVALVACFVGCDGSLTNAGAGGQTGGPSAGTGGTGGTGGNTGGPGGGTGGVCLPWVASDTPLPSTGLADQCLRDADCVAKSYGRCINNTGSGGAKGNTCFYECVTNQDCGTAHKCRCQSNGGGVCLDALCLTDFDCAPGKSCVLASPAACGSPILYACQTAADECSTAGSSCLSGNQCRWSGDHFACLTFCPVP